MPEITGPLVLVGCGKMGGALLRGWLHRGLAATMPSWRRAGHRDREQIRARHGVHAVAAAEALPADLRPRALVFAVKPQAMASCYPPIVAWSGAAAWCCRSPRAQRLPASKRRSANTLRSCAMPNTPAAIGQGVAALFANIQVSEAQNGCAWP